MAGSAHAWDRARVWNRVLVLLESLLPVPQFLTIHALNVDPLWEPLREHPPFVEMMERYR